LLFPVTIPLLIRASSSIDGVTLLAAYHTAYNVVGVLVLLPVINRFTRLVERILPERGSPLTRCLDPAALATPIATVEAVRRTVARALETMCGSLATALSAASEDVRVPARRNMVPAAEAASALGQAQEFMSAVTGPPESEDEQRRLTGTLHALDHASRLAETVGEEAEFGAPRGGSQEMRAAKICAEAMRSAASLAAEVSIVPAASRDVAEIKPRAAPTRSLDPEKGPDIAGTPTDQTLVRLERCAKALGELRKDHRRATLGSVASGAVTADEAFARVDAVRRLEALAHHAWRSVAHLLGRGA